MYRRIGDYAAIGNTRTAALVSSEGSIDWCCFPRFDGPALFLKILDEERGGCCALSFAGRAERSRQYLPGTNVLRTRVETESGTVEITDFMPVAAGRGDENGKDVETEPRILRLLRCTSGVVQATVRVRPTFNFAQRKTQAHTFAGGATFAAGDESLHAQLPGAVIMEGDAAVAGIRLSSGESGAVVLTYASTGERPAPFSAERCAAALRETVGYWEKWSGSCRYQGKFREQVLRSALALKLLVYEPSGAIVAAPTTSLPEAIGSERNWDYRFNWIRDSSLTVTALMNLGYFGEARDFIRFLHRTLPQDAADYQVMYGMLGETAVKERSLRRLHGYRDSRPVRIGNGALKQLQLDMYGEIAHGLNLYWSHPEFEHGGEAFEQDSWRILCSCADYIAKNWDQPDNGIWEIRGQKQRHTYSQGMCWKTLDRAIALAGKFNAAASRVAFWKRTAEQIRREFAARGYNRQRQAFTQTYNNDRADCSLLRLPILGVVNANDPRMRSTISFVEQQLSSRGLLYRYRNDDNIRGHEGTFTACSFWLAENYVLQGRLDEAEHLIEHVLAYANDLGLLSEEIDPNTGELLGNFPQGFTHIGLINAAVRLHEARAGRLNSAQSLLAA